MARLIIKSPYIKCVGGQNASGYLNYIATRERVEIVPDDRPPTRKQEQLTATVAATAKQCSNISQTPCATPIATLSSTAD